LRPHPEERPLGRVSKDGSGHSWFETALKKRLLTMRVWDLIPGMNAIAFTRGSIANGSRGCAPDDRLRDASRRMELLKWKML
jgi:hypothetical protein